MNVQETEQALEERASRLTPKQLGLLTTTQELGGVEMGKTMPVYMIGLDDEGMLIAREIDHDGTVGARDTAYVKRENIQDYAKIMDYTTPEE